MTELNIELVLNVIFGALFTWLFWEVTRTFSEPLLMLTSCPITRKQYLIEWVKDKALPLILMLMVGFLMGSCIIRAVLLSLYLITVP